MSSFTSQNCGAEKYDRIVSRLKVCLSVAAVSFSFPVKLSSSTYCYGENEKSCGAEFAHTAIITFIL